MISVPAATDLGASCAAEGPDNDLDYLVREVCFQVRAAGTARDVNGILQDASRHGPIMDRINAECGNEIAAIYECPEP